MPISRHKKQNSDQIRQLIILKYEEGKNTLTIAEELNLNYKTVATILRLYKNTGRIIAKKTRIQRLKKIDGIARQLILDMVETDCSVTLKALKNCLQTELNINVSASTIEREFKNLHYTFKRVQLIPEARNTEQNIQKRFEYANIYLALNEQNIIFVDEMGVNCSMRVNYGRSEVGSSPRKIVRSLRSRNYSISAAINKDSVLFFKTINESYNGERYGEFFDDLFAKLYERNITNQILILDNCSIHKVQDVRTKIAQAGHSCIFLPPYSPQLNPVEEAFSKWKLVVKSANVSSIEQLNNAILAGHSAFTGMDCLSYFAHMREFALKAVRREDF